MAGRAGQEKSLARVEEMIYVLGDSFCYGNNFLLDRLPNRKELLFSHLLAQKLNLEYKNYSIVGSSNQRLYRLINFLDIKKDDIVIVGWSAYDRIEIGVPRDRIMPNDTIIDYKKIDSLDDLDKNKSFQVIEKTENIYTRQIYPGMGNQFDEIVSPSCKRFVEAYYSYASDKAYHEQMFKILFDNAVSKLRLIGCKFLMFTTWNVQFYDTKFLDIPEYLFYDSNMLDEVRYKNTKIKHVHKGDYWYWSIEEQQKVTDILYNALREKYDIQ